MEAMEVTLKIFGMTCDHCVRTVEGRVKALQGVNQITVNLASQMAKIAYIPEVVTLDQIKKTITEVGYQVVS